MKSAGKTFTKKSYREQPWTDSFLTVQLSPIQHSWFKSLTWRWRRTKGLKPVVVTGWDDSVLVCVVNCRSRIGRGVSTNDIFSPSFVWTLSETIIFITLSLFCDVLQKIRSCFYVCTASIVQPLAMSKFSSAVCSLYLVVACHSTLAEGIFQSSLYPDHVR